MIAPVPFGDPRVVPLENVGKVPDLNDGTGGFLAAALLDGVYCVPYIYKLTH